MAEGHDTQAARLKEARKAAGLSQRDLAARLGTDPGHIAKVESGRKPVSEEWLSRALSCCSESRSEDSAVQHSAVQDSARPEDSAVQDSAYSESAVQVNPEDSAIQHSAEQHDRLMAQYVEQGIEVNRLRAELTARDRTVADLMRQLASAGRQPESTDGPPGCRYLIRCRRGALMTVHADSAGAAIAMWRKKNPDDPRDVWAEPLDD